MKFLLSIVIFAMSMSAFAVSKKNGENVSGYAQCMEDTKDCQSGCEKRCDNLVGGEYNNKLHASPSIRENVKARPTSAKGQ